jgi:D-beta-D-heptose 7-phosphate kinase / D-beta-D-heptose 1-phosphate adenosyltransferase
MQMSGPLVVMGDSLLDRDIEGRADRLSPEGPAPVLEDLEETARPGGAALAAAIAASAGHEVILVTALSDDESGWELRHLIEKAGVRPVALQLHGPTPEKIRVRAAGRSLVRMDRGCDEQAGIGPMTAEAVEAFDQALGVLVSDYGRGFTAHNEIRRVLAGLSPRAPVVWDPHPKGSPPVPGVRLATPNRSEASLMAPGIEGESLRAITARARELRSSWQAANVAVTLSDAGALLVTGDSPPMVFPATQAVGDPCGAGDSFSSAAALMLKEGALPSEAVEAAVETASRFVSSGGVRFLSHPPQPEPSVVDPRSVAEARKLIEMVRRKGGTVVATGGCFDLLHAGHVHLLQSARRLGDCLIVLLNSDDSVKDLKGPGRPLVTDRERAAILSALSCVDAVVIFDQGTPEKMLEELRPDIFAKGADYALNDLPETKVLARWGGQVVILPYLAERSTSAMIEKMAAGGTG